jgi:hypothetical protein
VDNKHNLVVATHTINRNDLNALGLSLWKQKKIWARYLLFWWIKATIMEGNAQCINNNITTIVAILRETKKVLNPILVAQFQYNKSNIYMSPRRNLTTGRWHKKSGRTEQSGYQFKKYRTPFAKLSSKFIPVDQQEEKSIGAVCKALKNNKRYQENPQLYRTRQEINEHIFGTIKDNGYNHTNLTGLEK